MSFYMIRIDCTCQKDLIINNKKINNSCIEIKNSIVEQNSFFNEVQKINSFFNKKNSH